MYYHNTRYKFALFEGSPEGIAGAVVLASAMPYGQLIRREMGSHAFLQHRVFDPQLYLSGLDRHTATKSVTNLASWPWFGVNVPAYDSAKHLTLKKWKDAHTAALLEGWRGSLPTDPDAIRRAADSCVEVQLQLGCEAVILATPLTNVAATDFVTESTWIDAGLEACARRRVTLPIFATAAIADNALRGIDPRQHRLLHTITNQIVARSELAGAYLVIEQGSEEGYVCTSQDTLLGILVFIDDLVRGGSRQVLLNYAGSFGPVAVAAGAKLFATGYYLSQRRLKLSDFEDKVARAFPRYFALRLAGDIGLEEDLQRAYDAIGNVALTDTPPAARLNEALRHGVSPSRVPDWSYQQQNITAAGAHYNWVMLMLSQSLSLSDPAVRVQLTHRWLKMAADRAIALQRAGLTRMKSDIVHQAVWLEAFEKWLAYAGITS